MNIKKIISTSICALTLAMVNISFADQMISDDSIASSVENKISSDESLHGISIKVISSNGVVDLSGNVDSDTQADRATELAQSTSGVTDVNISNLTIKKSQHPVNDAIITSKIKGMFLQQKLFGDKDIAAITIKVETNNGLVSLSGTADNQDQIKNAIKITRSIKGVEDVKSTIEISK